MQGVNSDLEELEESDFPAFPVVFQQELEESQPNNQNSRAQPANNTGPFKLPQKQINQLIQLTNVSHNSSYPQLFKETWESGPHSLQNFFNIYHPLNLSFVEQMKRQRDRLKIVRLSSHKIYVGEFKEDKCGGMSIVVFKNGNIYEGFMKDNKREGKGFYLQSGVGWFEGTFVNDLKSGQGIEVYYKKSAYQGNFLNGLRNNKGLYVDRSDSIYYGSWKLGIIHGKGTLKTAASIYHGVFVNSLKHGNGEERFTNGDIFKGEYQNNRFDGFGSYRWKKGDATYEGSFKNGLRHGKGKWSSSQTKYSGGYVEGLKEGYGQLYFPSGNFYKGNFVQDKREGYGQMFWTDGSFYKGEWKGGIQNGKGQIYLVGGEIISGLFQNSILVQITPSIYQKQMQISSMGIQDLFGSKQKLESPNKTRVFSESKQVTTKRRLAKIEEDRKTKKHSIKDNIYFRSPEKSRNKSKDVQQSQQQGYHYHGDGQQCKCIKRLQNFRLRQRVKTKMNESNVQLMTHHHD